MKFDHEHWHELDINVDSLWIMGPRAKGGKHTNAYHGNFAPQIPNQMIRRYTEEGDIVMDLFMGSGTTLYECETLKRNYIGFDINSDIINFVEQRMQGCDSINYRIHNCDVTNSEGFHQCVGEDLKQMKKHKIDLLIVHPPYLDIVKFTDKPEDLSGISNLNIFLEKFPSSYDKCSQLLEIQALLRTRHRRHLSRWRSNTTWFLSDVRHQESFQMPTEGNCC